MTDLYGCSDHGCMYGHHGGMGTNGGCRCEKTLQRRGPEGVKAARQIRLLRAEHDALQADAERYRWHSFDDRWPEADEIVQQYLGQAVLEQSNPPEWAFPVRRWRGQESLDNSATHWRYVRGPFG